MLCYIMLLILYILYYNMYFNCIILYGILIKKTYNNIFKLHIMYYICISMVKLDNKDI